MVRARKRYEVGRTIATTWDFPEGVPCVLVDGDSVFCTFPNFTLGMVQADLVCSLLNEEKDNGNADD